MVRTGLTLAAGVLCLAPAAARAQMPPPSVDMETIGRLARAISPEMALALTFRQYVAEAFVTPAGSMAPTLLGRHRMVVCPECGFGYRVSARGEVLRGGFRPEDEVVSATCPMCAYTVVPRRKSRLKALVDALAGADTVAGGFRLTGGERFLIEKVTYRFGQPQRWDVAAFKYPADPRINFVKRVVGLPLETVRIAHGDIFVRRGKQREFSIARKPPQTVRALLHLVYDNDYPSPECVRKGWPPRWSAWPRQAKAGAGSWTASEGGKSFETDGKADGATWLRYQHLLPSYEDWQRLHQGPLPEDTRPKPQLIADSYAYNTGKSRRDVLENILPEPESLGLHWVGDLTLETTVELRGTTGQVVFELVEGGRALRCRIDVATGEARLSIQGRDAFRPAAPTRVRGPGTHSVLFANVDDQLLLWIDGQLVAFDGPTAYDAPEDRLPQEADLAPAAIASYGAAVRLSHLKLFRDVYYIADDGTSHPGWLSDFDEDASPYRPLTRQAVAALLSDPGRWGVFEKARHLDFQLGSGQYLVLGDNSPRSKDSRLWALSGVPYYVRRDQFIGKVLVRYFPRVGIVR